MLKIPDKFAQARGGWSSDRVMKRVYQETFEKERINVDSAMDEYFSDEIIPEANEKYNTDQYRSFLKLLKKNTARSRKEFDAFCEQYNL